MGRINWKRENMAEARLGRVLQLLLVCVAPAVAFYGENSPVVSLTAENWSEMQADTDHIWLVEFYANWCGHCKQFAPAYEKVAKNLNNIIKVAAVDADKAGEVVQQNGVQGFPTVKLFLP